MKTVVCLLIGLITLFAMNACNRAPIAAKAEKEKCSGCGCKSSYQSSCTSNGRNCSCD